MSQCKNDQKNADAFLQKFQVSSQSRVVNSSFLIILVPSFWSATLCNASLGVLCVYEGHSALRWMGNDASFYWDPPFVPVSLFPGFVWAQSASSKLSQQKGPIWLDCGEREGPYRKINCLSLPEFGQTTSASVQDPAPTEDQRRG